MNSQQQPYSVHFLRRSPHFHRTFHQSICHFSHASKILHNFISLSMFFLPLFTFHLLFFTLFIFHCASALAPSSYNSDSIHCFVRRYMEELQVLYYYPIAIVVAAAIGSIGFKIFAIFTVKLFEIVALDIHSYVVSFDRLMSYRFFYISLFSGNGLN